MTTRRDASKVSARLRSFPTHFYSLSRTCFVLTANRRRLSGARSVSPLSPSAYARFAAPVDMCCVWCDSSIAPCDAREFPRV